MLDFELNWIRENPEAAYALAGMLLSTAITAVTKYAPTSGALTFLKAIFDLFSLLPHKDAKGVFGPINLPLFRSKPDEPEDKPRGFTTLRATIAIFLLTLGILAFSGCAFVKSLAGKEAGLISDVASCASEAALAVVGPLVLDLAESALHAESPKWAQDLATAKAAAKGFAKCLELAALHRVQSDFPPDPVVESRMIGFKPAESAVRDGSGSVNGVTQGGTDAHDETARQRATERLRSALGE